MRRASRWSFAVSIRRLIRSSHVPSDLASFLVRIAPRCAQRDLSQSTWRPCVSCLRYKRTLPQTWHKVSLKPQYPTASTLNDECTEHAISAWCANKAKANECPACFVRSFTRAGYIDEEDGKLPRAFMVCRACSWCRQQKLRPIPARDRWRYDGRPINR
jgi:hypothetical protein